MSLHQPYSNHRKTITTLTTHQTTTATTTQITIVTRLTTITVQSNIKDDGMVMVTKTSEDKTTMIVSQL